MVDVDYLLSIPDNSGSVASQKVIALTFPLYIIPELLRPFHSLGGHK